jgi:RimJ/RimL family protein N-acetyltransferase
MYSRDIDIPHYDPTKKLRLISPSPDYAPITLQWIRRPNVTRYLGADFAGMTLDKEREHINDILADDDRFSWMIERDGEIVGTIEINEIKSLSKKYGVRAGAFCTLIGDPKNWRQGLGSHAKIAASNWAFAEGGFGVIEAKAYIENVASWRGLEKLGYHFDGIDHAIVDDAPITWKVYSLTKR